jgi:transketolase
VGMLPAIWSSPAPAYVRINHKPGSYAHAPYEPGKAEIVARGKDVTLLVYGFLFENVLAARLLLEAAGLSVGLINMRSLKPVDEKAIVEAARGSERLVVIEDHFQTGGLYSIVAEVLLKHRVTADVTSLSLGDRWFKPGLLGQVLENEGFTPSALAQKIKQNKSPAYA